MRISFTLFFFITLTCIVFVNKITKSEALIIRDKWGVTMINRYYSNNVITVFLIITCIKISANVKIIAHCCSTSTKLY